MTVYAATVFGKYAFDDFLRLFDEDWALNALCSYTQIISAEGPIIVIVH